MTTTGKKIFAICGGISMIILSASLFVFSITSASAGSEKNPVEIKYGTPTVSGKYMMSFQAFKYDNGDNAYNVLVWDAETGKARIYYYDYDSKTMKVWNEGNIPANPLN